MSLKSIFVVACLCVVTLGVLSCADVPSTAPEIPDFRTQTRFINAYPGAASVEILLEPTSNAGLNSFATVDFQGDTGYQDVPAGNRKMKLQSDPDTTSIGLESDGKITIVVMPKGAPSDPRFRKFTERRTFDALPSDVGQVRFINAAVGGNFDVLDTSDSTVVAKGVGFGSSSGYVSLAAGSFTFGIAPKATQNVLATVQVTLSNSQRFTAVVLGDQASPAVKAFQDDPQ
ncbi:MAG: DUF4397 domain-containing protein [bacterium]